MLAHRKPALKQVKDSCLSVLAAVYICDPKKKKDKKPRKTTV